MIKKLFVFIFLSSMVLLFSDELPKPKNNMLYTEFVSFRTANYLKKALESSGYIVMDGKDKFLFRQEKPVNIEIRRDKDILTFKKENMEPIEVDSNSNAIALIFDNPEVLKEEYDIEKTRKDDIDIYTIIPKRRDEIKNIVIIGLDDKIEEIMIFFRNKSELIYKFKNTVTGTPPHEKYF